MVLPRLRARLLPLVARVRTTSPFIRDTSYFLFLFTAFGLPAIIFVNDNVCRIETVNGPSMYPYLNADYDRTTRNDVVVVKKWGAQERLERGMIVSLWSAYHPEIRSVKRVIALEGDKVYTKAPYPHPICEVPHGHVWVEGDGRHMGKQSLDSNYYGPVSKSLILGKMTWVLWPWSSFGRVRWEEWKPKTRVIKRRQNQDLRWI